MIKKIKHIRKSFPSSEEIKGWVKLGDNNIQTHT